MSREKRWSNIVNLKMCLNWKVIASLGAVAVGILVLEPHLAAQALPLLVVAVCPLSMLLMGGMMMGGEKANQGSSVAMSQSSGTGGFTCPMHPDARSDRPGRCPKCGMNLVPVAPAARPMELIGVMPREEQVARLQAQLRSMALQQAALTQQIEQLQAPEKSQTPSRTLAEAERVAQAAENSSRHRNLG